MSDHKPRFAIGIDLGTTNCSLAYCELEAKDKTPKLLKIVQWDGESRLFADVKLPSFTWLLPKAVQKSGKRRLPWHREDEPVRWVVGREAKAEALKDQARVIHSAKSWLSVGAKSTRQAEFLPWASDGVNADEKLSPLQVQTAYLMHLKAAWDHEFSQAAEPAPFVEQSIVITVPASFDELAQNLTLKAAEAAGYPAGIRLLEEPLAAFYDYIGASEGSLLEHQHVLVCDIGGGTSDFTLLNIDHKSDPPTMTRMKISEHLLLGGDNIDLSLCEVLLKRLQTGELPRRSWLILLSQARQLKEEVLSSAGDDSEEFFVSIPLDTHQLLGRYASASITRGEMIQNIIAGFFPAISVEDRPHQSPGSGLRNWGLPYAEDTAITRHLAAFLEGQSFDALLCAGGCLLSERLQQHLCHVLQGLQKKPLQLLPHASPDLAIARGAAYFAGLTQQSSARVQSPSPQSLYLSLEQADGQLLYFCLIPRAWPREKPARLELPGLQLRLGQDVGFRLFASNDAKGDHIAKEVPYHSSWRALPQLSTRLQHNSRQAKEIPVSLEAIIRETGLLELRCLADDDSGLSWLLDFSLETEAPLSLQIGSQTSPIDAKQWLAVENLLDKSFGNLGNPSGISSLTRQIEEIIGKRDDWTIPTLRALWKPLSEAMFRRQRDTDTESAWYYLAGYALRPGFGSSLDGERIQSLWRLFDSGPLKNKMDKKLEAQWYLMWRRVAGGLNRAQQNRLLDRILPQLRKEAEAGPELIRLAACLERADSNKRIQVGRALLQHIVSGSKDQLDARIWALARVASRVPLYAGPEMLLPIALIEEWAKQISPLPIRDKAYQKLTLFYAWAGRRRGEILTDLDEAWRQHFVERLKEAKASDELIRPVLEPIASDEHLLRELFGESLPLGLILKN